MDKFATAKVGDRVAILKRYGWSNRVTAIFGIIERVTPTQITAFDGRRFMRSTGIEVGQSNSMRGDCLSGDTEELRARIALDAAYDAAEKKCSDWADRLRKARGGDAVDLAANLPDLENEG